MEQFSVDIVGRTNQVSDRHYAISPERKIKRPAAQNVMSAAERLFSSYSILWQNDWTYMKAAQTKRINTRLS